MATAINSKESLALSWTVWPKDALMRRLHKEQRHDLLLSVFGLTGRRFPKRAPGFGWFAVSRPVFSYTFDTVEIHGPFETLAEAEAFVRARDGFVETESWENWDGRCWDFQPGRHVLHQLEQEGQHAMAESLFGARDKNGRLPDRAPILSWFAILRPRWSTLISPISGMEIFGPFDTLRDAKVFALPAYAQSLIERSAL